MADINDGLDLDTGKIDDISIGTGVVPGDKTDLDKQDTTITNPPALDKVNEPDNKGDKGDKGDTNVADSSTGDVELTEGMSVVLGDAELTIDKDGNAVDKDGNVVKTKEELLKLIAENGVEKEDAKTLIQSIQEKFGIEVKDDKGNPIEFENTPEGINSYIDTVLETREQEIATQAVDTLFNTYPALKQALNHIKVNGSLEGFNEIEDRTNVVIDKDNKEQQIATIKEQWKLQGVKGNVDSYIAYLESAGTLYDTAIESNETIKEIHKEAIQKQEAAAAAADAAAAEQEKQYWSSVDSTLNKGELAGYKIPDTIPVVRDGKKMVMTKTDFKNYISRPVDANGYTQYELDEMKRDQNSIIEDDLLRAYLRFTGGDYSSLVGMAINKEKVNKLRIAANKALKRTLVINSKTNDSKGKIDNSKLILE